MPRIMQSLPHPPIYVLRHNTTPFKFIEYPIINQITQYFIQRGI